MLFVAVSLAGCAAVGGDASKVTPHAGQPSKPQVTFAATDPPSAAPTHDNPAIAGELVVAPDHRVPGVLGSWFLNEVGSDAPWIPAQALASIPVTGSAELRVRFADASPIGAWQAVAARAADVRGAATFGLGGRETSGPPLAGVPIGSLSPGDWVLAVRLVRFDGRGEATFYWRLAVE